MLEICQHKANNTNMIQISMANWASSKFAVQITPNAISLILKKRTDLESMTDNELFAKRSRVAQNPKLEEDLLTWVHLC